MTILTLEQTSNYLGRNSTIAGLDLGSKTIGIAISDISLNIANPRPVLLRTKFTADCKKLLNVFTDENVGLVVIGLPINMDGSRGARAQSTAAFVRNMEQHTNIPFTFWDERLSTVAAERTLINMDVSRRKRALRIDSAAAAFILQGALDGLRRLRSVN